MNADAQTREVVVIGGGPAGSTVASLVARQGYRVALFEREAFPRPHIGESLLPASLPILEHLGVLQEVERHGFVEKGGATMVWGRDRTPWTWYFNESNGPYSHSYQVSRAEFDEILLDHASRQGVKVHLQHRVVDVHFEDGRATGVRVAGPDGEQFDQSAALIVDASGQSALIASHRSDRQWDDFFRNLAIYAYFEGASHLPEPDAGNIFIESVAHGWLWKIPLQNGLASVGAVVDAQWGQEQLRTASPTDVLTALIADAPGVAAMIDGAPCTGPATVVKDWSYASGQLVGEGFILTGDAACFIDPLFSSGVHLALSSGLLAAAYVCTALRHPELTREAGIAYEAQYRRKYQYFHEIAKLFYSSNRTTESYFWEARRLANDEWTGTPREAFLNVVAGNAPEGYERAVIEKGEPPVALIRRAEEFDEQRRLRLRELEGIDGLGVRPERNTSPLLEVVPRLAAGVKLLRDFAVQDGEFARADLLVTPRSPHGDFVIPPVAQLVSLIDGRRSTREIVRVMRASVPPEHHEDLHRSVLIKVRQLFVEGALDW